MTYWTAPATSGPATRMAAAMIATPAGFVKALALCVSLTAAGALVMGTTPAAAQSPDAAAPAAARPTHTARVFTKAAGVAVIAAAIRVAGPEAAGAVL